MNTSQIVILSLLFISFSTYLFSGLYLRTFLIQSASSHRYLVIKKIFRLITLTLAVLFIIDIMHILW